MTRRAAAKAVEEVPRESEARPKATHLGSSVPAAFQVGGRYVNRKGRFKVLAIEGEFMRIRWDNGEEVETSVMFQLNVLRNMAREIEPTPCTSMQRGHSSSR